MRALSQTGGQIDRREINGYVMLSDWRRVRRSPETVR